MLTNLGARGQHWQDERKACPGEPAGLQAPARQKSPSHSAGITSPFRFGISMSLVCAPALPTQHPHQLSEALPNPRGRWLCGWDAYPVPGTGTWQVAGIPQQDYNKHRAWLNLKCCLLFQRHRAITYMPQKTWKRSDPHPLSIPYPFPSSIPSPSASNPSPGKLFWKHLLFEKGGERTAHEQHTSGNSTLFYPHSTKQVEQLGAHSKKSQ